MPSYTKRVNEYVLAGIHVISLSIRKISNEKSPGIASGAGAFKDN